MANTAAEVTLICQNAATCTMCVQHRLTVNDIGRMQVSIQWRDQAQISLDWDFNLPCLLENLLMPNRSKIGQPSQQAGGLGNLMPAPDLINILAGIWPTLTRVQMTDLLKAFAVAFRMTRLRGGLYMARAAL